MSDYLITFIGNEEYAFMIENIQKIVEIKPPTKIAGSKEYMLGVVSYEGEALKIVDFKTLLHKKTLDGHGNKTLIYKGNGHKVGIVVDGVDRIAHINEESIKSNNKDENRKDTFVEFGGVVEFEKRLITLVKNIKISELA